LNKIIAVLPTLDDLERMVAAGALSLESRTLTAEERRIAREERNSKAKRNHIGEIGERLVQGFLERRFKRSWRKSPVVPRWNGIGFSSTDVDLLGSLGLQSRAARCEVKTTHTNRIPYSSFNKNERRYLAQAVKGNEIAFACLVWLDKDLKLKFMHAIPWMELLALEQAMFAEYGGKSLKKRDWRRLEQYQITKENGRFNIPPDHWLTKYLLGDEHEYSSNEDR
jgi:hypothetical protein